MAGNFNEENHYLVPSNIPAEKIHKGLEKFEKLVKVQLMKYTRPRRLLCRNGLRLQLTQSQRVIAGNDTKNSSSALQVISIGANMIAFWGRDSEMYLAVNSTGQIYSSVSDYSSRKESRDCVFIECFTQSYFNVYETYHTFNKTSHRYLTVFPNGQVTMSDRINSNSLFYWEILDQTKDENNNEPIYENI